LGQFRGFECDDGAAMTLTKEQSILALCGLWQGDLGANATQASLGQRDRKPPIAQIVQVRHLAADHQGAKGRVESPLGGIVNLGRHAALQAVPVVQVDAGAQVRAQFTE